MFQLRTLLVALVAAGSALQAGPASADVGPSGSVADATRRLDAATARLHRLNDQVEQNQGRLDAAGRKLDADQLAISRLNLQLAGLARFQYEQPNLVMRLAAARSISEAMADLAQTRIVANRQQALLDREKAIRRQDLQVRDQITADLAAIRVARQEAADLAAKAEVEQASAQQEALRRRAAQVAAQAAATSAESQPAPPAPGPRARAEAAVAGNHFDYGYCTWYVANRRNIPWFGNAGQWPANARAYGYSEGRSPQVGAVMVTAESGYGHVAYVESVNADGSWTVSEMNFVSWGVASRRTIRPGQVPVTAFIYGR